MRYALVILMALAGALATSSSARSDDDVLLRASIEPATVPVGEQAVLTVQVEGKFRRSASPELPTLDDFDVYQAGTSQNFSFVNGQTSSSIIFTYVLMPRREGTFRIEPIRFSAGGKQYTANAVTLEVVPGTSSVPVPGPGATTPGKREPGPTPAKDESIFVAASVDEDTVYVNQQVTWTLGYYTDGRVELLRSPNYSPPTAEGFWVEDLPPQNKYYANLHGRQYLVTEIKRAFFPTAPGVYTIGEARVDIVVEDVRRRGTIDDFFNRGMLGGFGQQRSLRTGTVEIVVLPLPESGKPAEFQGAVVRDLQVSISADKQVVQVGEPINVGIEMNGIGNMRTLAPPKLKDINEFKIYESGSSTDSFKKDYLVSGRRRFDLVLVPQAEGRFTIPPVRVPYFDPVRRAYAVAQSAPVAVEVQPGTAEDGRKLVYAGGDDFRVINRDIRYIHQVPAGLTVAAPPFHASRWFAALHVLPAVVVGASLVVERRRRRLRSDVGFARASRALRDAGQKLGNADRLFRSNEGERGFALVQGALYGYFADKMNVPAAGLTSSGVAEFLRDRGIDDAVAESIRAVIAACDTARYAAGGSGAVDGRRIVNDAREALGAVERRLR